jgi:cytochrome c biogenesis protein CcmG, thiol:disulfide interchange protein DsbE
MTRRRLAIALIALAAVALVTIEVATSRTVGTRPAPPLPTEVLNSPRVSLASLRGKPALLTFWASWCHPCQQEAPELERFARSLGNRGQLVGVDWSDDLGGARDFLQRYAWTFPVLRDSGEVGDEYGLNGLPTTFVLDRRGRIVEALRGPQTEASLSDALSSATGT